MSDDDKKPKPATVPEPITPTRISAERAKRRAARIAEASRPAGRKPQELDFVVSGNDGGFPRR